ncbi:MAG: hypothetical protein QF535_20050, partial [Anaerolineales bacterium]|nr:hypothetical protein [Anaerolineales bacterium]
TASNAQIATDAVTANEILAGAVGTAELAIGAVTSSEIAATLDLSSKTVTLPAVSVTAGNLASSLDLSGKTVTLPSASVTSHVTAYDDAGLRNDISTLALHSAIADNKVAYNLSNAFIDQFEDETGLASQTSCGRHFTSVGNVAEYIGSVYTGEVGPTIWDWANDDLRITMTGWSSNLGGGVVDSLNSGGLFYDLTAIRSTYGHSDGSTSGMTIKQDFGSAVTLSKLALGKRKQHGDINQATYEWSNDNSSWTGIDWTGWVGGTAYYYDDSGDENPDGKITSMSSAGVIGTNRLDGTPSENALYQMITGFTPFSARYVRYTVNSLHSAANDNASLGKHAWYTTTVTVNNNAAGNFTSTTQTATGTVSKMGIIVLYKNDQGTASLNNDLVASVSANGGTNYQDVTLVPGGTFSTGINIATANAVTISNTGTAPKYKISFANQSSGSKETRVHGVALLY